MDNIAHEGSVPGDKLVGRTSSLTPLRCPPYFCSFTLIREEPFFLRGPRRQVTDVVAIASISREMGRPGMAGRPGCPSVGPAEPSERPGIAQLNRLRVSLVLVDRVGLQQDAEIPECIADPDTAEAGFVADRDRTPSMTARRR